MLQWIIDNAELVGSTNQPGDFGEGSELALEIIDIGSLDDAGDVGVEAGSTEDSQVGPPENVTPPTHSEISSDGPHWDDAQSSA